MNNPKLNPKEGEDLRKKYNVLIIGAGGQGAFGDAPGSGNEHKYISFAHAFKDHEGFELVGFIDKDFDKAEKAKKIWNVNFSSNCPLIRFAMPYFDIAVVTTPDDTHYEILKELSECKLKLVICEKPLCADLQEAKEIVELYKEKNIKLMVNYTRRFIPHYDKLKQHGKPIKANCFFNRGWIHTATHAIDFFEMLGVKDYEITEIHTEDYRVWDILVNYDNYKFKETRVGDMPVWDYYNDAMMHVVNNVYNFLEGKEDIKCTGEHALKALEICYKLMNKGY
ncbi:MAG: Gfo/Idh/MocA family protein [Candidatus Odinarchaeota archaeon]